MDNIYGMEYQDIAAQGGGGRPVVENMTTGQGIPMRGSVAQSMYPGASVETPIEKLSKLAPKSGFASVADLEKSVVQVTKEDYIRKGYDLSDPQMQSKFTRDVQAGVAKNANKVVGPKDHKSGLMSVGDGLYNAANDTWHFPPGYIKPKSTEELKQEAEKKAQDMGEWERVDHANEVAKSKGDFDPEHWMAVYNSPEARAKVPKERVAMEAEGKANLAGAKVNEMSAKYEKIIDGLKLPADTRLFILTKLDMWKEAYNASKDYRNPDREVAATKAAELETEIKNLTKPAASTTTKEPPPAPKEKPATAPVKRTRNKEGFYEFSTKDEALDAVLKGEAEPARGEIVKIGDKTYQWSP